MFMGYLKEAHTPPGAPTTIAAPQPNRPGTPSARKSANRVAADEYDEPISTVDSSPSTGAPVALGRPTFGPEEVAAVARVLESGWVAGGGPEGTRLEAAAASRFGTKAAVAVSNCTAALHLGLATAGVGPGDEVLVADYTFPATGHSVLYCGAEPVFVDVRPDIFTIDPIAAATAVTSKTRAILAVDAFGQCADYDELGALAAEHDLVLIEDAACAAGAEYHGKPAGSFGRAACFSLHGRKGITSGEGGLVTTDDAELAAHIRKMSRFGIGSALDRAQEDTLPVPVFDELGWNYKLSEIQAAVALVQFDRLDALLARRRDVAAAYSAAFAALPDCSPPVTLDDRTHTWQAYVLATPDRRIRDAMATELRASGIGANFGTYASHLQPVYGPQAICPVSADLFERHLALPMHADLTNEQCDRVIDAVITARSNAGA